ncbi:hypothetical protein CHS0354_024647 [Potamilus streckersoni]|uniref:Uncharacterized protein n=1 Tax=Potamilus streckersoni TaxID=2493646 RepID=A0AAE0SWK6_9BIVA|nr:hypothetical protein CHS0354_024647 [Potamilus streckersoni]
MLQLSPKHKYSHSDEMLTKGMKFQVVNQSSKLAKKKVQAEKNFKKELHDVLYKAVTHDARPSLNRESYSTVAAHFISKDCVCGDKSPTIYEFIRILLKLAKCVETNVNDLPPIARLKAVMRQELDNRAQYKDLALLGCLLNPTMKDLEFLRDSEQTDGYALLLKVALDMADVKVNVKVKPETSDEQPSDILPPLPIVPSLLNVSDDDDKTG